MPTAELPGLIAGYAARMHAAVSGHHILSPLGAWVLLALVGPGAEGRHREDLEAVLGMDVDSAARYARALLDHPHPAVSAATALWHRPAVDTAALDGWTHTLPPATQRGDIPSQADVDEWARRVTQGLIPTFPLEITPETVLLLATALATRISWRQAFDLADADELDLAWGPEVRQVLRSSKTHRVSVADTAAAGRVGVHNAGSTSGLDVVSVVADASAAPSAVIAAAHEVALGDAHNVSLSDLPLGAGHAWTVTTRQADASNQENRRLALLPAWHASTRLDLLGKPALGFGAAVEALIALLPVGEYDSEAVQSAVASYNREGFEAAAVTATRILVSARAFRPVVRDLEVRFARPYAVVAVARGQLEGPWFGVPVFSGWVERADDAS